MVAVCVANLPYLTEFVLKSQYVRIARFQANNADIFGAVQLQAHMSITKAKTTKRASATSRVTVARTTRGQSTSISVQALLEVTELIRQRDRGAGG